MAKAISLRVAPLPARYEDLQVKYKLPNLNDAVHDVFKVLYSTEPRFVALLTAVNGAQAVEGATVADDTEAARMIRDFARKNADAPDQVRKANIWAIVKALRVVMKRHGIGRDDRKEELLAELDAPEASPSNPDDDDNGA